MFQKHGAFNFGYQFLFLTPTIIIFTKLNWKNYTIFACSFKLYTLSLTSTFHSQKFLDVSSNNRQTSYPFLIPFNWCNIMSTHKSIKDWTFDSTYLVGVQNLCKPLLPWSKNLQLSQPHFEGVVKSPLTLPKMGLESPPKLPKIQSVIVGVKTPRIGAFFIPLERSWSVDVQNGLAWAIWTSVA